MSKEVLPKTNKLRWPLNQDQRHPADATYAFKRGQSIAINDVEINRYLDKMGVKHGCLGYRYLIFAIQLKAMFHKMGLMEIYRLVAQECGANGSRIERAIRYAITPFGLTNKEFIAQAIDNMMYQRSSKATR